MHVQYQGKLIDYISAYYAILIVKGPWPLTEKPCSLIHSFRKCLGCLSRDLLKVIHKVKQYNKTNHCAT